MLGWIHEKMATQKSTLGGGKFYTSGSTAVENNALACNDPCALGRGCSTAVGNGSWDNAHTSNPSSRGERLGGEPSILVQHTQHIRGNSND
jgi:hypothetical protein